MQQLDELEQNIRALLAERDRLQTECARLTDQNKSLEDKVYAQRRMLDDLRAEHHRLQAARALSETDESKQAARRMIDTVIARVDKAIEIVRA